MDVALLLAIGVPGFASAGAGRRDSNAKWLAQASLRENTAGDAVTPRHTQVLPNPQILPVSIGNVSR
jgi:hypothetical protein